METCHMKKSSSLVQWTHLSRLRIDVNKSENDLKLKNSFGIQVKRYNKFWEAVISALDNDVAFGSLSFALKALPEEHVAGFAAEKWLCMTSLFLETIATEFSKSHKTSIQLGDDLKSTLEDELFINGNADFSNARQNLEAKYLRTN